MSDPETFTEAEVNEAADLLLGVPKVGEGAEAVPREAPSPDEIREVLAQVDRIAQYLLDLVDDERSA